MFASRRHGDDALASKDLDLLRQLLLLRVAVAQLDLLLVGRAPSARLRVPQAEQQEAMAYASMATINPPRRPTTISLSLSPQRV